MLIKINSSYKVFALNLKTLKEVSNIKQIPSKLLAAFNMCGDFGLLISKLKVLLKNTAERQKTMAV